MRTVAIVGGGFSGTMTAVNLVRCSESPLRVIIINAHRPFGRGTAYGTSRPEHLLNVAARNMSAFPDYPTHFFDWLRSRNEFDHLPDDVLRETFAPRQVYGDYIRGLVMTYLHPVDRRSHVQIETVQAQVNAIHVINGDSAQILLENGEQITADNVVLATGNQPPASFPATSPLQHDPRYCADPWDNWLEQLPPPGGRIVLLGTGLTMVDVVVTLSQLKWQGKIVAISRHGMLPQCHFRGVAYPDYVPDNVEELGLSGMVKLVEHHCERLRQMSQNPAIAIDKLRPHTQRLWASLSVDEKIRFLEKYATRWNCLRHRIAPSIHEHLTDALDDGRLTIVPGSIEKIAPEEDAIAVLLTGANSEEQKVAGDLVINCTGPQSRFSRTHVPLFQQLLQAGLVRTDELDMGIDVTEDFNVIGEDGVPSLCLYAMGPLLKGSLWETTAVPELRGQTLRVAQTILEQEHAAPEEYVIEYCI
ncbi:FAD/NAD(P)-binding protein [Calycomorphotria hydatis]|uniref:FAD-dependent urate hydroxylase HpyO/Asp monooxygenase CreE-like FAD/NAD(P)-binding domain-containing protein n=1 Tax=Calycomorphotria hydatis TaxID=2528027 RepID=A0A517TA61_9PLAN|nr:FAD/NAD(P)-binding protein [Calycomorphotria hydatis]QDT65261.1 hypothetical protein V22_25080 [Calycomorphotria hydatis]